MTRTACDLSHWRVAGQPFALECSNQVIEQLHRWTLTADLFPPERGTLLGTREAQTVRVLGVSREPFMENRGRLAPVGWFQIRLDANLHLTDDDLDYHNAHFPEIGAPALILRPDDEGSVRAGVFLREPDGSVRSASSYQEVTISESAELRYSSSESRTLELSPSSFGAAAAFAGTRRPGGGLWMAFLTGMLAGAVAFAAIFHVHPNSGPSIRMVSPAPPVYHETFPPIETTPEAGSIAAVEQAVTERTRELALQKRQLQTELDAEKTHSRRLEATLLILRDRPGSKPTNGASAPAAEAKAQRSTPLF